MPSPLAFHPHLMAYAWQFARAGLALALIIVLFSPLERFQAVRPARFFYKGWSVNFGWYWLNILTPIFLLGPPLALIAWAVHAVLPSRFLAAAGALPFWARFGLAMTVGEVGFYWGHRWSHEIPWLWRFHAVHHSAEHINFLVNTRVHPIDMMFTKLCGVTLLYATGLANVAGPRPTLIPTLVLFISSLWSYFVHANVRWRLGPVEAVFASPFFHHWHHTRADHKDHNYAAMLPFMDRLFGTHYSPGAWPAEYGTDTPMPESVTGQFLAPFSARATISAPAFPVPGTAGAPPRPSAPG
jgi:sterol desaturase/sphingolipid hydroxylase (fatty acid hydroxylase superfamily)